VSVQYFIFAVCSASASASSSLALALSGLDWVGCFPALELAEHGGYLLLWRGGFSRSSRLQLPQNYTLDSSFSSRSVSPTHPLTSQTRPVPAQTQQTFPRLRHPYCRRTQLGATTRPSRGGPFSPERAGRRRCRRCELLVFSEGRCGEVIWRSDEGVVFRSVRVGKRRQSGQRQG
jgi:hypothetical protein